MWILIKIKKDKENFVKNEISKLLKEECNFYIPKYEIVNFDYKRKIIKRTKKKLFGNYIFCFNKKFKRNEIIGKVNFVKGIQYSLKGTVKDEEEINNFINFCKKHENPYGILKNSFFFNFIKSKNMISISSLTNLIIDAVTIKGNKLKAQLGNVSLILNKNSNYCCYTT